MKIVDLFCGAGGLSLAAKQLKFDVIGALEFEKDSCKTYRKNFKAYRKALVEGDITQISPEQFMNMTGIKPGECDLVVGGPPCQGFSSLRSSSKKEGGDPRNKLLHRYFEYVATIQPKAFLVENVPGMLWEKNISYVNEFYTLAEASGYVVCKPQVLDAKNYGAPQTRKRVLIYGFKKSLSPYLAQDWPPVPTHGDSDLMTKLKPWSLAQEVFEKPIRSNDPNNIHMNHTLSLIEVFKNTPLNGGSRSQSGRVLPCHSEHSGHKDVYGRIDPCKPGPTMTTSCTNPSKGRFVHPTEHHGITVRHAARFQSFPDSFVFTGGIISASKQVGNAVPVKLGKALLAYIAHDLEKIVEEFKQPLKHTKNSSVPIKASVEINYS